eukprot:jgi/Mesen1/5477/ME000275S04792
MCCAVAPPQIPGRPRAPQHLPVGALRDRGGAVHGGHGGQAVLAEGHHHADAQHRGRARALQLHTQRPRLRAHAARPRPQGVCRGGRAGEFPRVTRAPHDGRVVQAVGHPQEGRHQGLPGH